MRRVDGHEGGDLNELARLGVQSGPASGTVLQTGDDTEGLEVAAGTSPNPVLGRRSLADHESSSRHRHRSLSPAWCWMLMVSASSVVCRACSRIVRRG